MSDRETLAKVFEHFKRRCTMKGKGNYVWCSECYGEGRPKLKHKSSCILVLMFKALKCTS